MLQCGLIVAFVALMAFAVKRIVVAVGSYEELRRAEVRSLGVDDDGLGERFAVMVVDCEPAATLFVCRCEVVVVVNSAADKEFFDLMVERFSAVEVRVVGEEEVLDGVRLYRAQGGELESLLIVDCKERERGRLSRMVALFTTADWLVEIPCGCSLISGAFKLIDSLVGESDCEYTSIHSLKGVPARIYSVDWLLSADKAAGRVLELNFGLLYRVTPKPNSLNAIKG